MHIHSKHRDNSNCHSNHARLYSLAYGDLNDTAPTGSGLKTWPFSWVVLFGEVRKLEVELHWTKWITRGIPWGSVVALPAS